MDHKEKVNLNYFPFFACFKFNGTFRAPTFK